MFGKLGFVFSKLGLPGKVMGGGVGPASSAILLEDNTSYLLLENGSKVLLE